MTVLYLQAIASVAFLAMAAAGAGRWIERLLPRTATALDRATLALLGGLGTLGTALFVIGQFRFSRMVIAGVLITAGVFGVAPMAELVRGSLTPFKRCPVPKIAAVAIAFVLFVTAIAGLAQITGDWESDAIAYHLLGPKVWLRDGIIRPVLDNCHTAFPQIVEVLYAALMSVGGERAPGFSAVLMLLLFLLVVARRAGLGTAGVWWAAALAATMPAVYAGSHTAFIDVFYASLVLAAARIGFDAERTAEFFAFGLFCGFAMGTKYTGILAFVPLLICATIPQLKRKPRTALAGNLGVAIVAACLVAAPAYLRNWILLGSPIYPPPSALLSIFHPKYLSAQAVHNFQEYILRRGAGLGRGPIAFLLLPFQLTYHTSNFHGAGGIGLAPLALAPLGWLAARRQSFTRWLALLAFLLTAEWFVTQQESRFLIHVYAILAVLAVLGWRWLLATAGKLASVLAAAVVALSLSYGCFMIASGRLDDLRAAVSPSYARLRTEHIPFFESFEYLNHTPSVQKVLILDRSVPPYYLDKNYLKPFGQWGEQVLPYATSPADVLPHLKDLGISHIMDVKSSVAPFQVPQGFPGLVLVLDLPNQRVYRVAN